VATWVYGFADGSREMRELLGGKGAGIAEMTRILGPESRGEDHRGLTVCGDRHRRDRELVRIAIARARGANADLELGVCGEHGGDPDSIRFFHGAGLDYVSCSPFRLPIARVATAQAAIAGDSRAVER